VDLARDTKQALAYAALAAALAESGAATSPDPRIFAEAMMEAVGVLVSLAGFQYRGIDPRSLEPVFVTTSGRLLSFDGLPTRARHLVAFAALTTRVLWAAYPGTDPRAAEAVVAIDEVDLHQDPGVQGHLVPALRRALPRVQWLLTTTSPAVAASCEAREVLALRRLPDGERIELYVGDQARTH
jgi:predicted ATP-binding protein involved in virulence